MFCEGISKVVIYVDRKGVFVDSSVGRVVGIFFVKVGDDEGFC